MNRTGYHGRPNGWQRAATVAKKRIAKPMTVIAGRVTRRQVAPTTFKRLGTPTVSHLAVSRNGRWRGAVISTWSLMGEELGRTRQETARTYGSSTEALLHAARLRSRMERTEPVDHVTRQTAAKIRRAIGRARAMATMQRLFASNGNGRRSA